MLCLVRFVKNVSEEEHDEIVWDVLRTQNVEGRAWQIVNFRMGNSHMNIRQLAFVKSEMHFLFDYIKSIKMKDISKEPRDLIPGRLQRKPRPDPKLQRKR